MAGADFIKTSTGKEGVNATLPVDARDGAHDPRLSTSATGFKVGFKPAGGISTAKDVLDYQFLMKEELGRDWLEPDLFRIGASSLLADIERQLEHHVTGRYSAFHRIPSAERMHDHPRRPHERSRIFRHHGIWSRARKRTREARAWLDAQHGDVRAFHRRRVRAPAARRISTTHRARDRQACWPRSRKAPPRMSTPP